MNTFIIVQIIFVLLNIVESRHDYYVIKLQNYYAMNFVELRKKWKFWSSVYYLGVICISIIISHFMFANMFMKLLGVLALLSNRAIFFEVPLNIQLYGIRKMFYIDSSSKTNIELANLFGKTINKNLGIYKFVFCFGLIIAINIFVK